MNFTHYNQSGKLTLHQMSRMVYDNAPAEQPKPVAPQTAETNAAPSTVKPFDLEKSVAARAAMVAASLDSTLTVYVKDDGRGKVYEKDGAPGNIRSEKFQEKIQYLKNNAEALKQEYISSQKSASDGKILPVIEKALPPAAPVYDSDGLQLTPEEIASGKLQYDVDGLRIITPEDITASMTLNQTYALIADPNGPLQGKVTLIGFQNYLRAGSGIAGAILATSKGDRPSYGTLTFDDLTTQNGIISSPVRTVEAIKVLQQNLGLKADGIFGPLTYDAVVTLSPTVAAMLRGESPSESSSKIV